MDTIEAQGASRKRRQGQTMAEFAITLPTLLIIMFGIIEFGRIFQAWVSLQNSARTAARYASTGQYDTSQFVFNDVNVANPSDDTGFIPCVDDGPNGTYTGPLHNQSPTIDRRGTTTQIEPNGPGNGFVDIYTGDLESVFATWYDGKNCDPSNPDDLDRRKDMARILSIMQEARRGAAGLAIESNQWNVPSDPLVKNNVLANWKQLPWFEGWERLPATLPNLPHPPRSDQRYWFNVVVCSNRAFTYKDGQSTGVFAKINDQDIVNSRFIPYYSGDTLIAAGGSVVSTWTPTCLLNENPDLTKQPAGQFSHAGMPYMDPGTSDNTVYVTVTFNHPLITPLGIAPFITLQARRSSIVESFRTSGSHTASNLGESIGGAAPMPTDTPKPPTDTPVPPTIKPTNTRPTTTRWCSRAA
ncbi:MAG: TadE family protein, partial [Chloroflexota bacterium]